ncbi:uncharacterized protein METZ01_LOCUS93346 [marine metagenome]|uniref:Uncharacterized protein n=1 Tax=marine metagenome TaxID=408172 RepID=A0A381VJN1_9ZZZZ
MAELPRYQRSEAAQAVPTSKAAADYGFSLAEKLRAFSNKQHDYLDQQARIEGKQAGLTEASGKTSGVDLSDMSTIRSRAFSEGAQLAHAAQIKIEVNENIARIALENEYDLQAFQTSAEGYKKGLLAEVDPLMRAVAETDVNANISSETIKIGAAIHKKDQAQIIADIQQGADLMTENVLNWARDGDIESSVAEMDQIKSLLNEGVDNGLIDPAWAANYIDTLDEKQDGQIVFGQLKRILEDDGLEAAEKALEAFDSLSSEELKKQFEVEIEPATKDAIVSKMETALSRERSDQSRATAITNAEKAAESKVLKEEAKDVTYALQHNQIPDGAEELIQKLIDNGDLIVAKDLAEELAITKAIINRKITVGDHEHDVSFIHQTTSVMEHVIAGMEKKENLSGFDAKLLERYRKVLADTKTGIAEDIMSLAVRQGRITELNTVGWGNPETIEKRMQQFRLVQALYGTTEGSPLTAVESNNLIKTLNDEETTISAKAQILGTLVEGFGDGAQDILKQMYDNDSPEYVIVGELMVEGQINMAFDILEGMDLLSKGLVNKPAGLDQEILLELGNAVQMNPKYAQMVIEAAEALYVQSNKGITVDTVDSIDKDILKSVLNKITGGVLDINGIKIIAPERGITEGMFEKHLDELRPNDLNAMGGVYLQAYTDNINDLPSEVMEGVLKEIKNATFISIGQGIYHVVLSKPGEPVELLKDKHGYNFVFKYDTVAGIESTWAEGVVVGDILDYEKLDTEKSAAKEAEEKAKEAEKKAAEAKKKAERVEEAEAQIAESDAAFEAGEMNADVSEIIKNIQEANED